MKVGIPRSFGAQLKALRDAAGFTQEELATIAGLSVHAVSALERGERRRPHVDTVRALSAALDLTGPGRDALRASARAPAQATGLDGLSIAPLPLPLTALLGRDSDMETLQQWIGDPLLRVITLIGPGGVGKTRLALELARAIAGRGSTQVVFVPLTAVRDHGLVAPAIAEALGLADASATDLPRLVRIACDDRPTLVVLDNFEHVLDAGPLVVDLLSAAASLRLLVTSRAPLRVRGERQYSVGPLTLEPGSETLAPADLARTPALRLFLERIRAVRPDFRLTAANGPTLTAICRRLDALPLALELAAPWLKVLAAEDLLRRIDRDVLLSPVGPRDLPERQQTMNATVAWSYQLLAPHEQRAFRRFGALPGLFPIDAADAVLTGQRMSSTPSDQALTAIAALMDKSLLLRAPTSVVATCPMYHMLETVRAYAVLELTAAGERDDAMQGVVRYATGEAALAGEGLIGLAQGEWLARVREDLESYRGALAWLIGHGRGAEASAIAWPLMFFWLIRGHAAEGLRWYEQILRLSVPPDVTSRSLLGAAVMLYVQGQHAPAREGLDRAMTIALDAGDEEVIAQTEHLLGHIEYAVGNMDAARRQFTSCVPRFRALSIPWGTSSALSGMAEVALAMGNYDEAERQLDDAEPALRDAGPWFRALGLYVRAVVAVRRGLPDEALALVRESLTQIRNLQDKFAFVYSLVPLAAAASLKGDDAWVARILGARDAVTDRTGSAISDGSVRDLRERTEQQARTRLGPERWAQAYAAGRRTSIDALLNDIDRTRA